MHEFLQQVFSGLAAGSIYASVALALVMIYRSTDLVNFAQGEMAMFSTYIAWTLVNAGLPFWGAFAITLVVSFVAGMLIERVLIRPVENAPVLAAVVVTIALLLIFNSVAGWIYTYTVQDFPSPFPDRPVFGALITTRDLGVIAVTLIMLLLLFLFFRFTSTGLAMRAAAQNPTSARLCGIRVGHMLAIARALMMEPRLLVLDEPSFGLAPRIVEDIFKIVERIKREERVSVLLVEQNATLALELSDHAYLLETGYVVASGSAKALADDPQIRRAYLGY